MAHDHHHGHSHADHDHRHDHVLPGPHDPAQESLSQALRAGFNILRIVMIVLLIAYFLSGWFQVNPDEQGLVARFGKLRESSGRGALPSEYLYGPGSYVMLPEPFDQKIHLSTTVQAVEIGTFSFPRTQEQIATNQPLVRMVPTLERLNPKDYGTMLTGDRNLSHGVWTINYVIRNGKDYVTNVGETPAAIKPMLVRLGENAILRTVAGMPVERVLRRGEYEKTVDFAVLVQKQLNETLSSLKTGVEVTKVTADTIEPGRVRQEFINVTNAAQDKERTKNEALGEASRILGAAAGPETKQKALLAAIKAYGLEQDRQLRENAPNPGELAKLRDTIDGLLDNAEGEVFKILSEGRSAANEARERITREFEEFKYHLAAYKKFPQLTALRLWVQMRHSILSSKDNEIFFLPRDASEIEIITNRDAQRQIEASRAAYQQMNQ